MSTITKIIPSGLTDGEAMLVTGTNTGSSQTFHTAHATSQDSVWLWAANNDSSDRTLTMEIGGATKTIKVTLPAAGAVGDGAQYVLIDHPMTNSETVKVFASAGSQIVIGGFIHRIT